MLEAMVHEVKVDSTNSMCKKASARTKGSSSPFRCIASLAKQMNMEMDQELSETRLRIQELEALAASKQKEVCMLKTRLSAAESMTHDVIRDLLSVKLDMTSYANLIDQYQVKKLVEEVHQQTEDFLAKEQEIIYLRKQISDLIDERKSFTLEANKREGDILAAQMTIQKLQDRDQFLSAQNEMLKMDKTKLMKKMAELDEMVKALFGTQSIEHQIRAASTSKYHNPTGSKSSGRNSETNYRKSKAQFG